MGSGEADVNHLKVTPINLGSNDTVSFYTTSTWPNTTTYSYNWPYYIYLYQVKCPKRTCKSTNWLQLNIITPCNKCGSKLKAVDQQADFEIPVDK